MIGKLRGKIDSINDDSCIVDVNGVGYILYCPSRMLLGLEIGQAYVFVTHLLVKEDQLTLFGFNSGQEKDCFLNLQTVQGVGAKMALVILNSLTVDKISLALVSEDVNAFKQISGIGPKLASRIINELKGKSHLFNLTGSNQNTILPTKGDESVVLADALSALSNLGFSKSDAFPVVSKLYGANNNISFDALIKDALAQLTR